MLGGGLFGVSGTFSKGLCCCCCGFGFSAGGVVWGGGFWGVVCWLDGAAWFDSTQVPKTGAPSFEPLAGLAAKEHETTHAPKTGKR